MRIDYLVDHPNQMATVAAWHHAAFGHLDPSKTLTDRVHTLTTSMQRDALPLGLVAHAADGTALGCASLVLRTLTHPELGPWLSAVYVEPGHRGLGVASALAERAAGECARLGFPELYLFTPHHESLYRRLGWVSIDRTRINEIAAVVMKRWIRWR
ncbi:MAG TPA: GNAT family N-acetyltransferase [Ideonella sp.]|uniref:GNAT family N-acetyltransferase n=1 Tax=Ideonella sp. TaxID=1929293 RepID=UPI002E33CE18|nr:GNAT family N-acetyltransferase [Ideonella sp.]HEX5684567.1 GNAT family N-acetyltransferase [Ideonella sp.]